jgi:hypothetical protein
MGALKDQQVRGGNNEQIAEKKEEALASSTQVSEARVVKHRMGRAAKPAPRTLRLVLLFQKLRQPDQRHSMRRNVDGKRYEPTASVTNYGE